MKLKPQKSMRSKSPHESFYWWAVAIVGVWMFYGFVLEPVSRYLHEGEKSSSRQTVERPVPLSLRVEDYWHPLVPSLKWETLEAAAIEITTTPGGMKLEVLEVPGDEPGEYVIWQSPEPGDYGYRDGTIKVRLGPRTPGTILASD